MTRLLKIIGGILGVLILAIAIIVFTFIDFSNDENLDDFVMAKMEVLEAKGLAVAFIKDNKISWSRNYGYENAETGKKVTDETIFQIASMSKPVTGAAIMQLYERGLIDLDTSINDYLPFDIKNPNFPVYKITVRMLLQHKSSLIDNQDAYRETFSIFRGTPDPDITLEDLLKRYYLAGGDMYDREANFSKKKPGEEADYSNIAFGLLGYIAEQVTGQPFNVYCAENIFVPLGMSSTGWFTTEIDLENFAVMYDGGAPLKPYGVASYPDGGLKTTVIDYSKFLIAMMNGGIYQGQRILKQSSVREMMPENPDENLVIAPDVFADLFINTKGHPVPGHLGGDPGVATFSGFNPENGTGMIIFMNGAQSLISPSPFLILKMMNIRSPYHRLAVEAGLIVAE